MNVNEKLTVTLVLSLVMVLVLFWAAAIYAQGPEGEGREERVVSQDQVGDQGLADPPTAGLSVLVMFTGAANDIGGNIATSVHCTNFGSSDVKAEIQFFSFDATSVYTDTKTIASNQTLTFSTQDVAAYTEDWVLNTGTLDQGSGRVLADAGHLICTAQVLDPGADPPVSVTELETFRP